MSDLAFGDQVFESSGYLFNRNIGVNTMLTEQVDTFRLADAGATYLQLP
jgi:hypothetical protein